MKSNKSNWITLLIIFFVVLFIFIKEDAFSKEKKSYINYLEVYGEKIPLKKDKKEYTIIVDNINITKIDVIDDLSVCTCDVTKIDYEKDKYEINTNATFDYEKKQGKIIIDVKDNNNIIDTYTINITYKNDFIIEEACKNEYVCPTF